MYFCQKTNNIQLADIHSIITNQASPLTRNNIPPVTLSQGNPALNYGSVSGLACFASFAASYFAGLNPFGNISWLWVWVPVVMMVMAIKAVREIEPGGPIAYWKAFRIGMITALFSATLYCLLLYLFGMLQPQLLDVYKNEVLAGMEATKGFLSDDLLDRMYDELEKTKIQDLAFSEFFRKMVGGFFISLVAAAILYRKNPTLPAA